MKTRIFFDGVEGHARRSRERAEKLARGERLVAEKIINFDSPTTMLQCLTPERTRLWEIANKKKLSISALAEELGRNRGSVTRDVNKLKGLGLLRLRQQSNPGHGVVQVVETVARKIDLRATLG